MASVEKRLDLSICGRCRIKYDAEKHIPRFTGFCLDSFCHQCMKVDFFMHPVLMYLNCVHDFYSMQALLAEAKDGKLTCPSCEKQSANLSGDNTPFEILFPLNIYTIEIITMKSTKDIKQEE